MLGICLDLRLVHCGKDKINICLLNSKLLVTYFNKINNKLVNLILTHRNQGITRRVKGYTRLVRKYVTGRRKRFRPHKKYMYS